MARLVLLVALLAATSSGAAGEAQGAIRLDNYTMDKMLDHPGWSWLVKFDKTHAHGDKEKAFKELAKLSSAVPDFFVGEVPVQEYGEKQNVDLREQYGFGKDDLPGYMFFGHRRPGDKSGVKYTGEINEELISIWLRGHGVKLSSLGTIAELDELARKFVASSFADEHLAEARKLVAGEYKRDKKAPVYVRIMEKLKEGGDVGYLEKEAKRVGNVLAQKNTPAKVTELNDKLKILAAIMEKDPSDLAVADSLEIVFVTGAGVEKTVSFKKKPLGLHFEQTLPMKVKQVQDHAKDLGVEAGWEVKTLGGTEIKGDKDLKFAEAMEVLKTKVGLLSA